MFKLKEKKSSGYFERKSLNILSTFLQAEDELLDLQMEQLSYENKLKQDAELISQEIEVNSSNMKKTASVLRNISKLLS